MDTNAREFIDGLSRDDAFERFMQSLTELRTLTEHELVMVLGGLAK